MDILAGRIDPTSIVGTVLVDGKEPPNDFHRYAGYVCQDDFSISVLTVRENLNFSAALRLPAWTTKRDREERVESLLIKLGLMSVADSKVGDEFVRGISGGERKRTNIGIELITEPCIIFLDEPTTGLDAHTAMVVMQVLKRVAELKEEFTLFVNSMPSSTHWLSFFEKCLNPNALNVLNVNGGRAVASNRHLIPLLTSESRALKLALEGRTIITSIHQPKSSIYKLFDSLTILANGRIVYHGAAGDCPVSYFRRLGRPFFCKYTTIRAGRLSDAGVGEAAGDIVYAYYVHDLPHKHKHQDFTQQRVERLAYHMCGSARGHVKKELSQPGSQTTSQPLNTTHWTECEA
ncbi:unnamed protein product [Schistocephalus solidus]|uniref:ABC transporter domain-containing protein n=1 Tax=Schistocephalus solidus TaxID=70667 RepID=A0A183SH41_SCHSO|nr:unnamed protein product [Schistocephalus solidus]